jgi:Hypothetical glycosyl hydrolase 6/Beta-galactosidase trimerisation domain
MQFSRRDVLKMPAAAAAAPPEPAWFDRPMRWGQLTLVENDPPKLDVAYWLDYFKRCHCDAVTLSAGGVVAYYPTQVPFHYRSAFLGGRDSFGELCRGCQKMNMVVVARVDPHAAHEDMFRAHPDWLARDEQGRIRQHWVMPELYVTCSHGDYNRKFLTEVIREVVSLYRVDGIFANRWANTGSFEMCYCEHCREKFRQAYGHELPRKRDPRDPAWRDYMAWYQGSLFSLMKLWDDEIRKINPRAAFLPNSGGGVLNALDWKRFGEAVPTAISDHQGRSGVIPPWSNGISAKVFRSSMGRKAIVGIFGINVATQHRWMKSVKGAAEQQIWMAEGVANDFRPWFTKFGGVQEDERWMGVVERFYRWHKSAERYLRDRAPAARVGLVYSQQTAHYYGGPQARAKYGDAVNGMYHALIEARVPFEMVHDRKLESLDRFKLLILANVAALSGEQCGQLRDFVRKGGSLVATFETSLYDEWGVPRKDFGLADVLGVRYRGKVLGPLRNSYLAFRDRKHGLLAGLEDAAYTVNCIRAVDAEAAGALPDPPITLIPSYPDLPMEYVYERVPRGNTPQVFLWESGASRTVYFPMDLDRTFWEVMLEDHGRLLANAVRWAMNEPQPIEVKGPGLLDITLWRQSKALVAHLVNFTNPMMMKGPMRELTPVGAQRVRLRLPDAAGRATGRLLVAGTAAPLRISNGWAELTVPSVLDHEVVVVEWR